MRQLLAFAALCLLLAACSGEESGSPEPSGADQAKAAVMFKDYEAARASGNPEAAEADADRLRERFPDSAAAAQLEATLPAVRSAAEALRETRRLRGLWDYQANSVGSRTQRSASIFSKTAEAGEDQPAALADAQLVLRDHPEWGRSAYLLLALSKFNCGKPCTMRIAFDEAAAEAWRGKQADSGKGPALFIEDEARFVKALEGAKRVRIELPKGSGSVPALVFEVGGYAPGRYAKP
jgi:hypothetical protein